MPTHLDHIEPYWQYNGYMNRMNATSYLCRLEPFSYAALGQNDFKRDQRYFKSFEEKWHQDIHNDSMATTELIPEHFYFPEILLNMNCYWLDYAPVVNTDNFKSLNSVFLP